jgi:hypothetical protein
VNPDDILMWPCGTFCLREDLADFSHKSDDYDVIPAYSHRWYQLQGEAEDNDVLHMGH